MKVVIKKVGKRIIVAENLRWKVGFLIGRKVELPLMLFDKTPEVDEVFEIEAKKENFLDIKIRKPIMN